MKKIILLVIILFCATTYNSVAQPYCTLPEGCSWSGPASVVLHDCLTVEYYYTICNGKAYFKIGDITAEPPCPPWGPQQVIDDAGKAILAESWCDGIRAFLINVNDCIDGNSSYSRECYYWGGPYPSEPDQLIACHDESCCESYWTICKTGVNPNTFSYTKTGSSAGVICPRPMEPGCVSVCDEQ